MSSAALQAAPHQPTSVGSHSPVAATSSSRSYTSGSSQARDPYYNQPAANASPSSTRRPSRRPSGNGAASNNQQQAQYYSPSGSTQAASRATSSSNNPASPTIAVTASPSGHPGMSPGDHHRGVPPVVSARTSSSRALLNASVPAAPATDRSTSSRKAGRSNEAPSAQRGMTSGDGQQEQADSQQSNGGQSNGAGRGSDDTAPAPSASGRSRRKAQQASGEALPHRPSGSREPRSPQASTAAQSRSQAMTNQGAQSPGDLSREASEVLNRVIISKPEVDIERERERMLEAIPSSPMTDATPATGLTVVPRDGVEDGGRGGGRSRQDYSSSGKREKNSRFGEYYLGNTLGEGEFGKVKMGWKQEGGVQVAIKLIRRDSVGTNPNRLAKIYREIAILREISHPNIVRLHEMVETEKQIGIILEYASGGELFDYILNHRYLKDNAARRLFAQLVSGVGYLHKKGIVHRDLKLENLLLDRNRNIIITDFGFANTFNPDDELGDEIEYNLSSREYVKRMELDKIQPGGYRRGDLMQTSCGSPCYAAPELVVSDSLYTGRKVDVWSCGVILYAMLAGYLPFDDDPANPEGDNINLLYKYIVSTPLTFPEYVTPHARDLLRRILVPDPRKRADLFEVARHSWLSEYSNVVGFITSSTTTTGDIANTTVGAEDQQEAPLLARSASVREPSKTQKPIPAVGDLSRKHGNVDQEAADSHAKAQKDNKRRTVQIEYVAPRSQTQRGEPPTSPVQSGSKTRARSGSQGPVEVSQPGEPNTEKPLPVDPPGSRSGQYSSRGRPPSSSQRLQTMPPPSRPGRDQPRSVSDNTYISPAGGSASVARPNTRGSMASTAGSMRLPNRASYSQPAAPTVADTNALGHMSQPNNGKNYNISAPTSPDEESEYGRPSVSQVPAKFARVAGFPEGSAVPEQKGQGQGHKRSSTIGSIFSRTNSIFGGRSNTDRTQEKLKKSYPPVSMTTAVGAADVGTPRPSIDSRRSISFGFGKKRSGSITGSQTTTLQDKPRRFSLLPASFTLKAIGIGKEYGPPGTPQEDQEYEPRPDSRGNYLDPPQTSRGETRNLSGSTAAQPYTADGAYDRKLDSLTEQDRIATSGGSPTQKQRYATQVPVQDPRSGAPPQFLPPLNFQRGDSGLATESESSLNEPASRRGAPYPPGFNDYEDSRKPGSRGARGVLQKNNRRFADAYEPEQNNGYGPTHVDNAGSSGAARKVMDFFRRRGKARVEDR